MTEVLNSFGKSTLARQIRFGLALLRTTITAALPAGRAVEVRLEDEANQIDLSRLAHRHCEEIRRSGEELRLLGVRH